MNPLCVIITYDSKLSGTGACRLRLFTDFCGQTPKIYIDDQTHVGH